MTCGHNIINKTVNLRLAKLKSQLSMTGDKGTS